MYIWRWTIGRPVATLMAVGAVVCSGLFALRTLPMGLLPALEPPVLTVVTVYPGASPEAVAQLITEPVEQAISTVNGLRDVVSQSTADTSVVVARFQWGTDLRTAREDITRRLDPLPLPDGAQRPLIYRFDPNQLPVMEISVAGGATAEQRARLVEERVVPRLEMVPGVASVVSRGAPEVSVMVTLRPEALRRHGLTPEQVRAAIGAAAVGAAAGAVPDASGQRRWPVSLQRGFESSEDLGRVVVGLSTPAWVPAPHGQQPNRQPPPGALGSWETLLQALRGRASPGGTRGGEGTAATAGGGETDLRPAGAVPVTLADVADIAVHRQEPDQVERVDGRDALTLLIYQQAGDNTVSVVRGLRATLDQLRRDFPQLQFTVTYDGGDVVERAVGGVAQALLVGSALAVLVLWWFLRDARAVAVVAAAIPVSVCATLAAMYLMGMTLNVMSLAGLSLSAGVLVDQAIVVLESIARCREEGDPPPLAAERGTREVAAAITGSTVTNLIVFWPVAFLGGFTGQLFRDLAVTNALAQTASLLVAVTLVPAWAAWWLRPETGTARLDPTGVPVQRVPRWLEACLARPRRMVLAGLVLTLASLPVAARLGTEFLPSVDQGTVEVAVTLPPGSSLQQTDGVLRRVEGWVSRQRGVAHFVTRAGAGSLQEQRLGPHQGVVRVQLAEGGPVSTQWAEALKRALAGDPALSRPGLHWSVQPRSLWTDMGAAAPVVELAVSSADPGELREAVDTVTRVLAAVPGLGAVNTDLDRQQPELALRVDAAAAARHGLAPLEVGRQVRLSLMGETVARAQVGGRWVPVTLRTAGPDDAVAALGRLPLAARDGWVKLDQVARLVPGETPAAVVRRGGLRTATVTARVENVPFGTALEHVREALSRAKLPAGAAVQPVGTATLFDESLGTLRPAVLGAVLLVYMVMAAQFESWRRPLLIMVTLPLAAVGAIAALWLTGHAIGLTAIMGAIVVAGIVVNNGIVLVDAALRERAAGADAGSAIRRAWRRRVRPVLMTALTTLLGALPMLFQSGRGGELEAPLAAVLVGGLLTSTILTLVVLPCGWLLLEGQDGGSARGSGQGAALG